MTTLTDAALTPLASGIHGDIVLSKETSGVVAVLKVVQAARDGVIPTLRPHNIAREAALLKSLRHENIVKALGHSFDEARFEHVLKLEVLAVTLSQVIATTHAHKEALPTFHIAAKGIFSALTFLHDRGMAHRDIKPANVMLNDDGVPKLIDFGTVWETGRDDGHGRGGMTCHVGTGPYRAPEVLFSPERYDAAALDLWSAGVTLAEFFRPLRGVEVDSDESDGEGEAEGGMSVDDYDPLDGPRLSSSPDPAPLFDSSFGEIGLAASIFRRLGTPTAMSWPTFKALPDARKVAFEPREPRPLASALVLDDLTAEERTTVLTVVEAVVCLDPRRRIPAAQLAKALGTPPALPALVATLIAEQGVRSHLTKTTSHAI